MNNVEKYNMVHLKDFSSSYGMSLEHSVQGPSTEALNVIDMSHVQS